MDHNLQELMDIEKTFKQLAIAAYYLTRLLNQ